MPIFPMSIPAPCQKESGAPERPRTVAVVALLLTSFDGLYGVLERLRQLALADRAEDQPEEASLEVLAFADDDIVDVGRTVGVAREGVSVAGVVRPGVGIGRLD